QSQFRGLASLVGTLESEFEGRRRSGTYGMQAQRKPRAQIRSLQEPGIDCLWHRQRARWLEGNSLALNLHHPAQHVHGWNRRILEDQAVAARENSRARS